MNEVVLPLIFCDEPSGELAIATVFLWFRVGLAACIPMLKLYEECCVGLMPCRLDILIFMITRK